MKTAPPYAKRGQANYAMFDRFSLVHATVGAMLGIGGAKPSTALVTTLAWELAEPTLKYRRPDIFPAATRDRPANKFGDMLCFLTAYAITKQKK